MRKITEVQLPGVGVRYEFTSARGERIAVVAHRGGRQDVALYDHDDADTCRTIVELDSRRRGDVGEHPRRSAGCGVRERDATRRRAGPRLGDGERTSAAAGTTIADGRYRTETGTSIVAVIREQQTYPAPGPDFVLEVGDVAVAVGTPEGLTQLRAVLAP